MGDDERGSATLAVPPEAAVAAGDGLGDVDPLDAYDASDERVDPSFSPGRFLVDLADVLRAAGLDVEEVDGWQRRARRSGGYRVGPVAIIVHHTAGGPGMDGPGDVNDLAFTSANAPVANLYLNRAGRWHVLAAGATNTNGKGGPLGPLPVDEANTRVIGIEAGNNGIGEPWPTVLQDAYVAGVAALADAYDIPTECVFSHWEWTTRKIDPAGPSRFGTAGPNQRWNMDNFRAAVARRRGHAKPAVLVDTPRPPSGEDGSYVVQPGDSWWRIAERTLGRPAENWPVIAEANGGRDRRLLVGQVITIPGLAPPPDSTTPPFPGTPAVEEVSDVVLAWQLAMIACGVIRDNAANRDRRYGPGMQRAVTVLQQSWGFPHPNGIADERTWRALHGAA